MNAQYIVNIILKLFPILVFFTSSFSHFSGAEESVLLFDNLGGDVGRYLVGGLEMIAGFLMIMPGRSLEAGLFGGVLSLGMLVAHFGVLGIEFNGDGSYRFVLALILFASCAALVFIHRSEINGLPRKLSRISWRDIKMP